MARGELLKRLIGSYGRDDAFREVALEIIEEEERKNNVVLAGALRRALDERGGSEKPETKVLRPLPFANSAAGEFIRPVIVSRKKDDVVLSIENQNILLGLLEEYVRSDEIRRFGLPVRSKILFCGAPGTGKTVCAEAFAAEARLPLYVVKLDRVVSSYLGETATNVRKVFEFAQKNPCVLFFDEFDALATTRLEDNVNGELRRLVNNLLLFVDELHPRGFLIAATNMSGKLDPAVWRRFDEVIWFENPDRASVVRYLKGKLRNVAKDFQPVDFAEQLVGYSYAELERICVQSIKVMIIKRRDTLEEADFAFAIAEERRRRLKLNN